jgi:predicted metal-binding protein
MAKRSSRPVATPAYSVVQTAPHQLLVCKGCKPTACYRRPGPAMIANLREAVLDAKLSSQLEVTGTACMGGCDSPCSVALRGPNKASWLFYDLDPADDVADIIEFTRLYIRLRDGWCRSVDRPGKLAGNILARLPAMVYRPADEYST